MKKLRMFCLITALVLVVGTFTGCGSSNSETGGKTSMFGKYEFFTDKDMELFRKDEVSINLNGNTYTLGMTKDEIEDMLGEEGEGYRHESRTDSNSFSSVGSYVIEPDGYEYYYSVNNYYYYPNNKLAIKPMCRGFYTRLFLFPNNNPPSGLNTPHPRSRTT